MRSRNQSFATAVLLVLLISVIIWRGVVPAFQQYSTDFPNYYTAARLVLERADLHRLYDDAWFQEQMTRYGFLQSGKFSPFPPPTALVLVPVAGMNPRTAFRVLTIVNILALLGSVVVFRSIANRGIAYSAVMVLSAGLGVINSLKFGQLFILGSLLLLVALRLHQTGRVVLSGICAGVFMPVKYFAVVMVSWWALMKEWQVVAIAVVTTGMFLAISTIVLGWPVHWLWLTTVLPDHLGSRYSMQSPFAIAFQSWDSLLMRVFVRDPQDNPYPLWEFPILYVILKFFILVAGIGVLVHSGRVIRKAHSREGSVLFLGLLSVAALLFAPGTATYHFVLLWLPMAIVLGTSPPSGQSALRTIIVACYVAIGWIPYGWFRIVERWGTLWTPFAYPRLFLLTAMFVAFAAYTNRMAARSLAPAEKS